MSRRAISLKGETYQRLKDYCDATGRSVSGYLEDVIAEELAQKPQFPVGESVKPSEDKMFFLNGSKTSFRCDCGGNVFREVSPLKYKCNSCGARHTGEK